MTVDSGVQCERKRTLLAPECFQRWRTSSRAWMGRKALRKGQRVDKGSWPEASWVSGSLVSGWNKRGVPVEMDVGR